jgi:hypothetical protein
VRSSKADNIAGRVQGPLAPYRRMLPAPVSFQRRGHILGHHHPRSLSKLLRAPARLTNLSALVLVLVLVLSVLFNLRSFYRSSSSSSSAIWDGSARSIVDTFPSRAVASPALDHLVVVPGHAIWVGTRAEEAEDEDAWLLLSIQKGRGSPSLLRAHIARG